MLATLPWAYLEIFSRREPALRALKSYVRVKGFFFIFQGKIFLLLTFFDVGTDHSVPPIPTPIHFILYNFKIIIYSR